MPKTEGEILRLYLREKKITQEDLANRLHLSRNTILNYLKSAELNEGFKKLLAHHGYDVFANAQAKGYNMVEEGTPIYELSATATKTEYASQLPESPAFHVKIPGYEDCNFGMHVYGHSMYPTIETGSLILCRRVNDKSIIMYGEIYLIRTGDYLMVKRLQKNSAKGFVLCTSDNFEKRNEEFKRFEPFEIAIDKIIDLYLVKGIIKKTQS